MKLVTPCNTLSPYYFIRFYNMKRSIRSERVKSGTILQPLKFCMFPFLEKKKQSLTLKSTKMWKGNRLYTEKPLWIMGHFHGLGLEF